MTREPTIIGNDWGRLVPGEAAVWSPEARVSICIPAKDPGERVDVLLRCLEHQTYPLDKIEVVVADDGSAEPIVLPGDTALATQVVRVEHAGGFGAGRARNAAAAVASGDVLVFLDVDVIPERRAVESYVRWFERSGLVAVTGICRFVDLDRLAVDGLVRLVADDGLAAEFSGADVDDQSWRERHFARMDDLRQEHIDAFRTTIGATIAVSAEMFDAVGGFPEYGVRGVEDTAFGYRLHNEGAVMVLDRDAMHWHRGRRSVADPAERAKIDEIRAPYIESAIPVPGFRRWQPPVDPPIPVAPVVRVHVRGDRSDRIAVATQIERLGDRNVVVAEHATESADEALCQADLPADVTWGRRTVHRITELLARRAVGVIRVHLADGSGPMTVARTRALRRAHHVCPDGDPVDTAAELFGSWSVTPASLDLTLRRDGR